MKRTIIFILVMVLISVSTAFAGDVNGVRGSKWGSSPFDVKINENIQGGIFVNELINDNGLYELQFNYKTEAIPSYSFYEFHDNKLIKGGIIIAMDESDWSLYYLYYREMKIYLGESLNSKPKYNDCDEIQVLDESVFSCKVRKNWMGEQIAFKKAKLYNIFESNHTIAEISLYGGNNLNANIIIYYKAL